MDPGLPGGAGKTRFGARGKLSMWFWAKGRLKTWSISRHRKCYRSRSQPFQELVPLVTPEMYFRVFRELISPFILVGNAALDGAVRKSLAKLKIQKGRQSSLPRSGAMLSGSKEPLRQLRQASDGIALGSVWFAEARNRGTLIWLKKQVACRGDISWDPFHLQVDYNAGTISRFYWDASWLPVSRPWCGVKRA